MSKRVGGIITLKANGDFLQAKGGFSYNIGNPQREAVVGSDGVHGFRETPQVSFIEGEITDSANLNLADLTKTEGATITLELANGKVVVLRDAWYAGDGNGNSEEGNIACRFEAVSGEEVS